MTIKDYRESLGMSRAEMARVFDIPVRTLENWDAGVREPAPWVGRLLKKELIKMGGCKGMTELLRDRMRTKVLGAKTPSTETDIEYYYAIGQLLGYLFSIKKWTDKGQSVLSNILNAGSDKVVKDCILQQYKLVSDQIPEDNKRVKNLLAMVMGYTPEDNDIRLLGDTVLLGYADDNLVTCKTE